MTCRSRTGATSVSTITRLDRRLITKRFPAISIQPGSICSSAKRFGLCHQPVLSAEVVIHVGANRTYNDGNSPYRATRRLPRILQVSATNPWNLILRLSIIQFDWEHVNIRIAAAPVMSIVSHQPISSAILVIHVAASSPSTGNNSPNRAIRPMPKDMPISRKGIRILNLDIVSRFGFQRFALLSHRPTRRVDFQSRRPFSHSLHFGDAPIGENQVRASRILVEDLSQLYSFRQH